MAQKRVKGIKRKSLLLAPRDNGIMQPDTSNLALSLLACRRGHVGDWLLSPSSGWRVCRACRLEDRRRLKLAHDSIRARSAAKFGKPRRASTPIERYRAAARQRTYRAKLASDHQAHEPID
jgi:hypothetical protein